MKDPVITGINLTQSGMAFTPNIKVTRRADNGHFEASGHGLSVTHFDQVEAVNRLSDKLQRAFIEGQIIPTV